MSLSHGEMNQMEAAAINRQEAKEHLLLEQEIMGKWARGELVEVCRCEHCFYFEDKRYCSHRKGLAETDKNGYCQHAERKEKNDETN